MSVQDELELVSSIYCNPGEFHVEECSNEHCISVIVKVIDTNDLHVKFTCKLHNKYPFEVPVVYMQTPSVNHKNNAVLQNHLNKYLNEHKLIGQPMLHSTIEWIKEHAHQFVFGGCQLRTPPSNENASHGKCVYLLQLDHMRCKQRYLKHLNSFANELNVFGFVFFACSFIFILVNGAEKSIKKFIVKIKSEKVDVNSSGQPCKEKLMKIIGNKKNIKLSCSVFNAINFDSIEQLKIFFDELSLSQFYLTYVQPIVS